MGYDPKICNQKLTAAGLTPSCEALSNPFHCDDLQQISPVIHKFCSDQQTYYAPVQALVCIYYKNNVPTEWKYWEPKKLVKECSKLQPQKDDTDPTGWTVDNCYCCCSCFAYNTMIAVPDGMVAIQELNIGNLVRTARIHAGKPVWDTSAVTFSSGVSAGVHPYMVYINHGDETTDLICNADQIFALADGSLVRASQLALSDELMGEDGKPVKLNLVAVGNFVGGIHHISTEHTWTGSPDNHLVLAGGVVAGDFTLQMNYDQLPRSLKVANDASRPHLGTEAYLAAYKSLQHGQSLIAFSSDGHTPQAASVGVQSGRFHYYTLMQDSLITKGASFLTAAQSIDILTNGEQLPLSNPVPQSEISNIFHILRGFYPDFNFYLDWFRMEPNIYAFEEYGQKNVVVTGGFARMVGLSYEGLMIAVAAGLSRYIGLPPTMPNGYVGTGAADYFAFGVISRAVWYGNNWIKSVMPAFKQLDKLFGLISPANAGGVPGHEVEFPSIDCRLEAMQSGMAGGGLPTCCGGPPVPTISLLAAASEPGGIAATLSFAPIAEDATDVANYALAPEATITKATVDPLKNFIIHLETTLKAGDSYTLTISNLHNIFGGDVDPKHNSATFTAA